MCGAGFAHFFLRCGHQEQGRNWCTFNLSCPQLPCRCVEIDTLCSSCREGTSHPLSRSRRISRHHEFRQRKRSEDSVRRELFSQLNFFADRRDETLKSFEDQYCGMLPKEFTRNSGASLVSLHKVIEGKAQQDPDSSTLQTRLRRLTSAVLRIPLSVMSRSPYVFMEPHYYKILVDNLGQAAASQYRADFMRAKLIRATQLIRMERKQEAEREAERDKVLRTAITDVPASLHLTEGMGECPICLIKYGESEDDSQAEAPARLHCGHIAGRECLTTWMKENQTCPFCRVHSSPPPRGFWKSLVGMVSRPRHFVN